MKIGYDGISCIEERKVNAGNEELIFHYVNGIRIDEVINMFHFFGASGTEYYYHYDGKGWVTALTEGNESGQTPGAIHRRYEYTPYGVTAIFDDAYAAISEDNAFDVTDNTLAYNRTLYAGREYDPETNLYYYRARHYSPETGRFIQRDPIGYGDDLGLMNMYAYVGNNPVRFLDPYGLQWDSYYPVNYYLDTNWREDNMRFPQFDYDGKIKFPNSNNTFDYNVFYDHPEQFTEMPISEITNFGKKNFSTNGNGVIENSSSNPNLGLVTTTTGYKSNEKFKLSVTTVVKEATKVVPGFDSCRFVYTWDIEISNFKSIVRHEDFREDFSKFGHGIEYLYVWETNSVSFDYEVKLYGHIECMATYKEHSKMCTQHVGNLPEKQTEWIKGPKSDIYYVPNKGSITAQIGESKKKFGGATIH